MKISWHFTAVKEYNQLIDVKYFVAVKIMGLFGKCMSGGGDKWVSAAADVKCGVQVLCRCAGIVQVS